MSHQHQPGEEPSHEGVDALDDMLGPHDTAPIPLDEDRTDGGLGDTEPEGRSAAPVAAPAPTPRPHPAPARPVASSSAAPPPAPARRGSPLLLPLMLLAALLAGALLAYGLLSLRDGGDGVASEPTPTTSIAPTGTATGTEEPSATEESSPTEETSTSSSTSSSSSPTRRGVLPAGASACGGEQGGIHAASGTEVTSCPFAQAVRDEYLAQDPGDDGSATLEVVSPTTGRSYSMSCSGAVVTRCTGGNNAVVLLY